MFFKPKVATREELPDLVPAYKKLKGWKKQQDFVKARVGEDDRDHFYGLLKDSYFIPANRSEDETIKVSPSGRYALRIARFSTGPGTWNFSEGAIYELATGKLIEKVRRNYGHFPFCWVEGHPNGHDYLVCGESYTGQTLVELDTGTKKDTPKDSWGFCWITIICNEAKDKLVVDGCYWASSGETIAVDFSDPMSLSWPEVYRDDSSVCATLDRLEGDTLFLKGDRYILKSYEEGDWDGDLPELKRLDHLAGRYLDELSPEDRALVEEVEDETGLCYDDFCTEVRDEEFTITLGLGGGS